MVTTEEKRMCEGKLACEEKPGGGVALGGATGGKGKKKGKRSRGHKVDKSTDEGPRGKTEVGLAPGLVSRLTPA